VRRFAILLPLLIACSDGSQAMDAAIDAADDATDGAVAMDASVDATIEAGPDAADAAPDAPPCTCSGVSTCCDGCMPRNMGMTCVDALVCTGSSCGAAGTCVSTGVPVTCTPPAEPECQLAACADPGGCATTNIRQGMGCSDDNAGTYNDTCNNGACVGTPCECSSGPCCDGCHFRANTHICEDDVAIAGDCDGPYDQVTASCGGTPSIILTMGDRYCSGSSSQCSGGTVANGITVHGFCTQVQDDGMGSMPSNPLRCMPEPGSPLGERCRRCL
jgi:hypothetical protein